MKKLCIVFHKKNRKGGEKVKKEEGVILFIKEEIYFRGRKKIENISVMILVLMPSVASYMLCN